MSGYWRGWQCGNDAVQMHAGKPYCATHYTIAAFHPERFEEARKAYERAEAKRSSEGKSVVEEK